MLILSSSNSENVWTSQRNVLGIQHQDLHQCERFPACGFHSAGPHAPRPRQCAALLNNGEAGDLRRYRANYDVIVMKLFRKTCPIGSVLGIIIGV